MTSASVEIIESADRRRGVAALMLAFASDPWTRWVWPDACQYATYWPRAAEAHGGHVEAANAPGGGARVTVTFGRPTQLLRSPDGPLISA